MKKIVCYLVLTAGIMASLSSCSSTHTLVVDTSIPADQTVTVTFVNELKDGWFILREWNNVNIIKDLYGDKSITSDDKAILTVPAGNTSFTFDMDFTIDRRNILTTYAVTYPLKNIELKYYLEQGKKYHIKGQAKSLGFLKGYELFVGIYDAADNTLLKEWKLGEIE